MVTPIQVPQGPRGGAMVRRGEKNASECHRGLCGGPMSIMKQQQQYIGTSHPPPSVARIGTIVGLEVVVDEAPPTLLWLDFVDSSSNITWKKYIGNFVN